MAKIPAGAWVMVGDGEKALFLRNDGDDAFPNLTLVREANKPSASDQAVDGPGARGTGGGNPFASTMQEDDFHRLEKDRFAKGVAELLYKAAHRGEYDKLIVAAPPQVLGELRKALHKEVESRLLFDLPKELTNHPIDEIEKALAAA